MGALGLYDYNRGAETYADDGDFSDAVGHFVRNVLYTKYFKV